jgi:hypothetical protein
MSNYDIIDFKPNSSESIRLNKFILDHQSGIDIISKQLNILEYINYVNQITGEYIKLSKDYSYFPLLVGSDGRPIPLYEFVEVLDEAVDYDHIKELLPTISISQIAGSIAFLRKLVQFNFRKIDIDDYLDMEEENERLINELSTAFTNQEGSRVLNFD